MMKNYAEEKWILPHHRKLLISSFTLQNGTLITRLLLFYLQFVLVNTKIHCFVEYTPNKCFNSFVESAVEARTHGDENPNLCVFAETRKLLANSSYGYQIIDRSQHTVTKYINDKKTQAANISKNFKKLENVNKSLYEVELAKAQIEHKEPFIVGFFLPHYAKLRMLELYCKFFTIFCVVNKGEVLETDRDLQYFALDENQLISDLKWEPNGRCCDRMAVLIVSLLIL